jgi:membrane dipeptidase
MDKRPLIIDALQYCNWSEAIFHDMREGAIGAVHATICYHENFRETVANIASWNRHFERFPDLICHGRTGADVARATEVRRTAIFFGAQNPSCIEDDIGLVQILHGLGLRFMQLTYNNQSLLASGCSESEDSGLTRMGREVVREMNRVGMVIDMSHSAEHSTLQAIGHSTRPVAITHANPSAWHPSPRNKSDDLLKALAGSGGMLGFSLYPNHLRNGSRCTLKEFSEMVARTAEIMGTEHIGLGSDLCQDQPDAVVHWMRNGRWTKAEAVGGGFPPQAPWFTSNRDHLNIAEGLKTVGFADPEIARIMGGNWLRFFNQGFEPG